MFQVQVNQRKSTLRKCKQAPEMIKYFTFDIWDTEYLFKLALLAPWVHKEQLLCQASTNIFPSKQFFFVKKLVILSLDLHV